MRARGRVAAVRRQRRSWGSSTVLATDELNDIRMNE